MIRSMEPEDLEGLVALVAVLHIETPYRAMELDWPRMLGMFAAASSVRTGFAWVSVGKDGKIDGFLLAEAKPYWFVDQTEGARVASDLIFYSRTAGAGRLLLAQMKRWAWQVPRVVRIELAVSSGNTRMKAMDRMYRAAGFRQEGTFYVMNHPRYQQVLDATPTLRLEE